MLSAFAALALLRLIGLFTGLTSRQQARNVDFCLLLGFLIFLNKIKPLPAKAVLCVSLYRLAVDNKFEIVGATYGQRSDRLGWEVRRNHSPRLRAFDVKLSFWAIESNLHPVIFVCVEPNTLARKVG